MTVPVFAPATLPITRTRALPAKPVEILATRALPAASRATARAALPAAPIVVIANNLIIN